ncbi:MAG: hypothetical protein NTU44_18295 [Bacteroidetes bacterium]|nr:hypothetical protein [Bacteroidota bacterium]
MKADSMSICKYIILIFYLSMIFNLLITVNNFTQGQTIIQYNKTVLSDQGNLRLIDFAIRHVGEIQDIAIEFSIKDNKGTSIFNAISKSFTLRPGLNILNISNIQPLTIFKGEEKQIFQLPDGTYCYIIKVISIRDHGMLAEHIEPGVRIINTNPLAVQEKRKLKTSITVGSSMRYSDMPFYGCPDNDKLQWSFGVYLNSEIGGLPFNVGTTVSNSTVPIQRVLKKIQFSLNVKELQKRKKDKFIRNLKSKSSQYNDSSKLKSLAPVKEILINEKYPNVNKLRSYVGDFNPGNQEKDLMEYNIIRKKLSDTLNKSQKSKEDYFTKRYNVNDINDLKDSCVKLPPDSIEMIRKLINSHRVRDSLENKELVLKKKIDSYEKLENKYKKLKGIENQKIEQLLDNQSYGKIEEVYPELSQNNSFIDGVESFNLGTLCPRINKSCVQGIQLDGIEVSHLDENNIFKQITIGRINRSYDLYNHPLSSSPFNRMLYCGILGIGSKDGSHLHFHYVVIKDYANNSNDKKVEKLSIFKLQENYHFGLDYALQLFEQNLKIHFTLNNSLYIPDQNSQSRKVRSSEILLIPFVKGKVKEGSIIGFAENVEIKYSALSKNFEALANINHFGSNYLSMAIPQYYNDLSNYQLKLEKQYMNKKISLSVFYQREIEPEKQENYFIYQVNTRYGLSTKIKFPRKPYIFIDYYPFFHREVGSLYSLGTDNKRDYSHVVSLQTGYENVKGVVTNNIMINCFYQLNNFSKSYLKNFMQVVVSDQFTIEKFGISTNLSFTPMNDKELKSLGQQTYTISFLYKPKFGSLEVGVVYNKQNDIGSNLGYKSSIRLILLKRISVTLSIQYINQSRIVYDQQLPKFQAMSSIFINI